MAVLTAPVEYFFTLNLNSLCQQFCLLNYFSLILCCSVSGLNLGALHNSKVCCIQELPADACCTNAWDEM